MLGALIVVLQATTSPSVVSMLLQAVVGIGAPMAATWLAMQVSKLTATVNGLPDWEKRILVVVWSVVITGVAHALNIKLPDTWGALGAPDMQVLLTACGAFLIQRITHPQTGAAV